ncbi:Peptide methionine sulfoxide reductase MsrA [Corchorus olitorius]|uniref:peptide-methionine (S)-S-oxide reductase n=1 Tax=Corchorus olitorius TaxID=93759 RepID=A0A1R3KCF4_9ROSI|nr:Peptide methionine sulfoxide reductase MsrA [Corchorus olitorius]
MYQLLPQFNANQFSDLPISQISPPAAIIPSEFLKEAVFAGGSFWGLEAAFGRVDGVIKTATGYCGGTLRKPSYREVCEGKTGHTEAVKVIYDKRKVSFKSLCDIFWEIHDCTNKDYLKNYRLCESLNLRSTEQFVESTIACKLNGILAMEARSIVDELTTFLRTNKVAEETKLVCKEIVIEVVKRDEEGKAQIP